MEADFAVIRCTGIVSVSRASSPLCANCRVVRRTFVSLIRHGYPVTASWARMFSATRHRCVASSGFVFNGEAVFILSSWKRINALTCYCVLYMYASSYCINIACVYPVLDAVSHIQGTSAAGGISLTVPSPPSRDVVRTTMQTASVTKSRAPQPVFAIKALLLSPRSTALRTARGR
jgi:hypothetical protein